MSLKTEILIFGIMSFGILTFGISMQTPFFRLCFVYGSIGEARPTKDTALYVTFSALLLTGLFAVSNNTVYCSFKAKQLHFKTSKQTK